jgi:hypothetical protein
MRKHRNRQATNLHIRVLFLSSDERLMYRLEGRTLAQKPNERVSLAVTLISLVLIVCGVLQILGWMGV